MSNSLNLYTGTQTFLRRPQRTSPNQSYGNKRTHFLCHIVTGSANISFGNGDTAMAFATGEHFSSDVGVDGDITITTASPTDTYMVLTNSINLAV